MSRVLAVARFLWEFVIGDDPQIALWVTLALLGTLVLSHTHVAAWWLLPLTVAGVLVFSLRRVTGPRGH